MVCQGQCRPSHSLQPMPNALSAGNALVGSKLSRHGPRWHNSRLCILQACTPPQPPDATLRPSIHGVGLHSVKPHLFLPNGNLPPVHLQGLGQHSADQRRTVHIDDLTRIKPISAETSPHIMGGKCGPAVCGVECRVEPASHDDA